VGNILAHFKERLRYRQDRARRLIIITQQRNPGNWCRRSANGVLLTAGVNQRGALIFLICIYVSRLLHSRVQSKGCVRFCACYASYPLVHCHHAYPVCTSFPTFLLFFSYFRLSSSYLDSLLLVLACRLHSFI